MCEPQVRALASRLWDVYRAEYGTMLGFAYVALYSTSFEFLQPSAQVLWLKLAQEAVSELCVSKVRVC